MKAYTTPTLVTSGNATSETRLGIKSFVPENGQRKPQGAGALGFYL